METNDDSRNNQSTPKTRLSLGSKSLILFGLIVITFTPMLIWALQPQYRGLAGYGMAMMIGYGSLFIWLPMFITAGVQAIIAICKNKGRVQGIVTLFLELCAIVWIFSTSL